MGGDPGCNGIVGGEPNWGLDVCPKLRVSVGVDSVVGVEEVGEEPVEYLV